MKKATLIVITVMAACTAPAAHAGERSLNVLLTGGAEANVIFVSLSQDGRSYIIDSLASLEAPGEVCVHPEGLATRLSCEAAVITSFEVNAGGGDDQVSISSKIAIPVTLRGGPGNDRLRGGAGADKLVGGDGRDSLTGVGGSDWLYGGAGEDSLFGGSGEDRLVGGLGADSIHGGPGADTEAIGPGDHKSEAPATDRRSA